MPGYEFYNMKHTIKGSFIEKNFSAVSMRFKYEKMKNLGILYNMECYNSYFVFLVIAIMEDVNHIHSSALERVKDKRNI